MQVDEVLPSDYAILALCLAAGLLAHWHAGPKVGGALLMGLVILFAVADRAFVWPLVVGTNVSLGLLVALERRGHARGVA